MTNRNAEEYRKEKRKASLKKCRTQNEWKWRKHGLINLHYMISQSPTLRGSLWLLTQSKAYPLPATATSSNSVCSCMWMVQQCNFLSLQTITDVLIFLSIVRTCDLYQEQPISILSGKPILSAVMPVSSLVEGEVGKKQLLENMIPSGMTSCNSVMLLSLFTKTPCLVHRSSHLTNDLCIIN